jgi:hypothetical protein
MAKVPREFQHTLWSYDVSRLDTQKDADLIITQFFNYGGKEAQKWVFKNYPNEKILEVLAHPQRGMWLRETLREVLNKADLTIDPLEYEAAIINFSMPNSVTEEVWKRKGFVT